MSITITHLDGPLKGQTQSFDDTAASILVGRSAEAQIRYPEECTEISGEHLRLNRTAEGWQIELCGAGDAEIDGQLAEDRAPVTSGSIVTVGDAGPRFEIKLPGLTIKHLTGPLAGRHHYFPPDVVTVMFGRSREEAQVVYPPDCTAVGVNHCELKRSPAGDYSIKLIGKRHVAMDGRPVLDGTVVRPGAVLQLGGPKGPSFKADIGVPARAGYLKTAEQPEMPDIDQRVRGLTSRTAAGLGALAVLLLAFAGYSGYQQWRYMQIRDHLLQSVYLVVAKDPNGDKAEATAFMVGPTTFATNAHVTEALRGKVQAYYLLGPTGDKIAIADVESHPGYAAFKAKAATYAKSESTTLDDFQSAPLPSAYDVGLIHVYPADTLPEPFEVVSAEEALALKIGDDVLTAGFPSEDIRGADNLAKGLATATFRKGTIESLKDIFFSKSSDDPKTLLLVQHGIPVTGGMSGSPLVDARSGKVVAVISGGNTKALPATPAGEDGTPESLQKERPKRITDAAQVNFSQRADLLSDLMNGTALASLSADQAYWEAVGAKFPRYFTLALERFKSAGKASYGDGQEIAVAQAVLAPGEKNEAMSWSSAQDAARPIARTEDTLRAAPTRKWGSHVYTVEADPGFVYGFIADTIDALPSSLDPKFGPVLTLTLKQTDSGGPTPEPETLPLALKVAVPVKTKLEVVLGGLLQMPVRYALHVYRWPLSAASAATDDPTARTEAVSSEAATAVPAH